MKAGSTGEEIIERARQVQGFDPASVVEGMNNLAAGAAWWAGRVVVYYDLNLRRARESVPPESVFESRMHDDCVLRRHKAAVLRAPPRTKFWQMNKAGSLILWEGTVGLVKGVFLDPDGLHMSAVLPLQECCKVIAHRTHESRDLTPDEFTEMVDQFFFKKMLINMPGAPAYTLF